MDPAGIVPTVQPIYYLELSKEPIRFDAVSTLTNVFFDDTNRQVKNGIRSTIISNLYTYF